MYGAVRKVYKIKFRPAIKLDHKRDSNYVKWSDGTDLVFMKLIPIFSFLNIAHLNNWA